jgi:hypothetical protein
MERALAIPKSTDYFSTLTSQRLLLNAYFSTLTSQRLLLNAYFSTLTSHCLLLRAYCLLSSSLLSPLTSDHSQCDVMPTTLVVT